MKQITFLDTETTIKNAGDTAIGKNKASPFLPDNEIVWAGWKMKDSVVCTSKRKLTGEVACVIPDYVSMLVGQNIGFDLLHLMKDPVHGPKWIEWAQTEGRIWDTMIAEYLLSGQQDKFISLDALSERYGGTVKDSRMKEYWDKGVCTSLIPDHEIRPYLEQDVLNTEIVFNGQFDKAMELDMMALISSQMDARLATIMMEYNGMHFDKMLAYKEKIVLQGQHDKLRDKLGNWMATHIGCSPTLVNPNSSQQMSAVLYGVPAELTFKERMPMLDDEGEPVLFKSGLKKGQARTKWVERSYTVSGVTNPSNMNKIGASGYYSVGDDELRRSISNKSLLDDILKLRELTKQINTYFDGYSRLVFPDDCIHGNLNHCQTNTGRLSSSQPNLQNISNRESD